MLEKIDLSKTMDKKEYKKAHGSAGTKACKTTERIKKL